MKKKSDEQVLFSFGMAIILLLGILKAITKINIETEFLVGMFIGFMCVSFVIHLYRHPS